LSFRRIFKGNGFFFLEKNKTLSSLATVLEHSVIQDKIKYAF
jgi:hypothetical protein